MCILLYRVYEKSGKINKTQKNPKKPKKTQPLPYKRSDWDRVFLGYTPPPVFELPPELPGLLANCFLVNVAVQ